MKLTGSGFSIWIAASLISIAVQWLRGVGFRSSRFNRSLLKRSLSSRSASVKQLEVNEHLLDSKQAASAKQFERQSDRYGKSHILANTEDLDLAMKGIDA